MHQDMRMKQSKGLDYFFTLSALKKTNVSFLLSSSNPISQRGETKSESTKTHSDKLYAYKNTHTQQGPSTKNAFILHSLLIQIRKNKVLYIRFFFLIQCYVRLHIHLDSCLLRQVVSSPLSSY